MWPFSKSNAQNCQLRYGDMGDTALVCDRERITVTAYDVALDVQKTIHFFGLRGIISPVPG